MGGIARRFTVSTRVDWKEHARIDAATRLAGMIRADFIRLATLEVADRRLLEEVNRATKSSESAAREPDGEKD